MTKHAAEAALEKMNWQPDESVGIEQVVKEALKYVGHL
jgi:hypothetical protein